VDTDVCGDLADLAFDADAYTRQIGGRDIPEDAKADLASGDWLFGRGIMDMKAGLALYMSYLAHMARCRRELGVNLLFLAVPDEEGNSAGMRGSLSYLCTFLKERGLDLAAALSGEPAFWMSVGSGGRPVRRLFTGSTGKIMPLFFCIGREAHAGCSFDGVNAAALAARVVCLMDSCPDLMEGYGTDTLLPPACLSLKDLRGVCSVTLPERAAAFFNMLCVERCPLDVLEVCRDVARRALEERLDGIRSAGHRFQERTERTESPVPPWEPKVFTVRELTEMLAVQQAVHVSGVEAALRAFADCLPETMDEREKGLAVTNRLVSQAGLKGRAGCGGRLSASILSSAAESKGNGEGAYVAAHHGRRMHRPGIFRGGRGTCRMLQRYHGPELYGVPGGSRRAVCAVGQHAGLGQCVFSASGRPAFP